MSCLLHPESLLYDPKVRGEVVIIILLEKKISTKSERFNSQDIEDRVDILVGGGRHGKCSISVVESLPEEQKKKGH